jgi:hypothetical protein
MSDALNAIEGCRNTKLMSLELMATVCPLRSQRCRQSDVNWAVSYRGPVKPKRPYEGRRVKISGGYIHTEIWTLAPRSPSMGVDANSRRHVLREKHPRNAESESNPENPQTVPVTTRHSITRRYDIQKRTHRDRCNLSGLAGDNGDRRRSDRAEQSEPARTRSLANAIRKRNWLQNNGRKGA